MLLTNQWITEEIKGEIKKYLQQMTIKTTMRYHFTSVRMTIIKSLQITNAGRGCEKREPSYTVGGNVSWCTHCGKQYGGSIKT